MPILSSAQILPCSEVSAMSSLEQFTFSLREAGSPSFSSEDLIYALFWKAENLHSPKLGIPRSRNQCAY